MNTSSVLHNSSGLDRSRTKITERLLRAYKTTVMNENNGNMRGTIKDRRVVVGGDISR